MARVTIERLLDQCESRFEAVFLASYLAQEIVNGRNVDINADNKYAVLALRIIEQGKISISELRETVLKRCILDCQVDATKNSSIIEENSDDSDDSDFSDSMSISTKDSSIIEENSDDSDDSDFSDSMSISDIASDTMNESSSSIISQCIDSDASVHSLLQEDDMDE